MTPILNRIRKAIPMTVFVVSYSALMAIVILS